MFVDAADQNLRLRLDETTIDGMVAGSVQVEDVQGVIVHEYGHGFVGNAVCVGLAPTPCQTLQLDIEIHGVLRGGAGNDTLYQFEQSLTATLTSGNGQPPVVTWKAHGISIKLEQTPG